MRTLAIVFLFFFAASVSPNAPIQNLDAKRFGGKWYSLYSTPTQYDKGSRHTTTTYKLTDDGYYQVETAYQKGTSEAIQTYRSKLFLNENTKSGALKAQFIWPFKAEYWIIEVGSNYEYAVIGHPTHDYLFILSRKPQLNKGQYEEIVARCKSKGYPVEKLTSQLF